MDGPIAGSPAVSGINNVFDPQSPLARGTVDLFRVDLVVSALIFALVSGLVVVAILRFRAKSSQGEPRQVTGHRNLEIAWTLGPVLILVFLFVLTVRAMRASDPPGKARDPDVVVIGHQFWWEVRYPHSGAVTANEIHIPAGRRLLFELRTADVIHDFWVAELSRKMDMMPDRANLMWVQADRAGMYHGACAEFCGTQHAWMRILVVAEPPEDFEAWQRRQLEPPAPPAGAEAERGARLVRQLTCVNCHAIDGTNTTLQAGPDLRHLMQRRTLGAGVSPNTPEHLAAWLRNPQAVKPGNLMPNMQLSDQQVAELVSYLRRAP